MDVKKKELERKLLSEECWIELGEDPFRIRVDYLTRAQETEYRRLALVWGSEMQTERSTHYLDHYLRSAIRDIDGLTIDGVKARLMFEQGKAKAIVAGEYEIDMMEFLATQNLLESAWVKVMAVLAFDEVDKKKLQSQPNSPSPVSSEGSNDSQAAESLTHGAA